MDRRIRSAEKERSNDDGWGEGKLPACDRGAILLQQASAIGLADSLCATVQLGFLRGRLDASGGLNYLIHIPENPKNTFPQNPFPNVGWCWEVKIIENRCSKPWRLFLHNSVIYTPKPTPSPQKRAFCPRFSTTEKCRCRKIVKTEKCITQKCWHFGKA